MTRELINSVGMKLVRITRGTFMMGSPNSDVELQHKVTISNDFYLGVFPVTQSQFASLMGYNRSYFDETRVRKKNADLPVESVTWYEAVQFCQTLSAVPDEKHAGRVYRLPTEAEWEYACRAGSTTAYSFGDGTGLAIKRYGWCVINCQGKTHSVGEKSANDWGLHDMHGNVYEWCLDRHHDYPKDAVIDPRGQKRGAGRVKRGGSWHSHPEDCRSAKRSWGDPSYCNRETGFRIALSPSRIPGAPANNAGQVVAGK